MAIIREAIVEKEMLIWARKTAHLTEEQAAHKVNVSIDILKSWEEGQTHPTIHQLRTLSSIYKRHIAIFYLPEPPKEFTPIKDFRKYAHSDLEYLSPHLQFETRLAQNRREIAIELLQNLGYEIPTPPNKIEISNDFENVELQIRKNLGVTRDEQLKFSDDRDAFEYWKKAIEDNGVLIFFIDDVETTEMRGFSISEIPLPIIAINDKDSKFGRIFTLLHEYVHILLREHGLCDFTENQKNIEVRKIEVFCNRLAGGILVPEKYFLLEEPVIENAPGIKWEEKDISFLANKYKVSREVILRRLLIFDRITLDFYKSKMNEYESEYQIIPISHKKWFSMPHWEAVHTAGVPYTRLVLDNYNEKKITASDMADFMNVKLKHIDNIASLVDRKIS